MSSNADRPGDVPAPDDGLDQLIRDLGIAVTEEGKARWRERLSKPISPEALAEGRRMRERARAAGASPASDDGGLDQILRNLGIVVTEEGKARWRERLSKPISPEALAEGRRMRERARRGRDAT